MSTKKSGKSKHFVVPKLKHLGDLDQAVSRPVNLAALSVASVRAAAAARAR
ncbi:MAG: hypothetical protein GF320_13305 [Armatimonadia bacterium]|nr:hypothetical protein [Armatimonadia bacterium]